ncbi:MAG TPA: histidine phosphatase family protein [Blastocatellia bacterium]|nr:histidine phosphatase family protein [Blastocatellia bacterium]
MKTLLLLRHAKSDWDDRSVRDFDRPLAPRGERDAPRMGKELRKRGPLPDLIISSPAARAQQTIEAFLRSAQLGVSPNFDERIYGATTADLTTLVRSLPDSSNRPLLVGHNPAFEETLARFTGVHEHMPTAAMACIEFQVDHWANVEDGQGTLAWLLTPKEL